MTNLRRSKSFFKRFHLLRNWSRISWPTSVLWIPQCPIIICCSIDSSLEIVPLPQMVTALELAQDNLICLCRSNHLRALTKHKAKGPLGASSLLFSKMPRVDITPEACVVPYQSSVLHHHLAWWAHKRQSDSFISVAILWSSDQVMIPCVSSLQFISQEKRMCWVLTVYSHNKNKFVLSALIRHYNFGSN